MTLSFCSFSSGSRGNCYLIKTEKTAVLVDAGISCKQIFKNLEKTGTSLEQLKGLLITHEHSDHAKSIKIVAKKHVGLITYANENTWKIVDKGLEEFQKCVFQTGKSFFIEDLEVKPFLVSHDAIEPVGFSFFKDGKQISILTDTGCVTEEIFSEIVDADILILEANHDVEMLRMCNYPRFLKERVLSDEGHLSNVVAGETICKILKEKEKKRFVILAHLSRENNFPEMAYLTVKNILEENNFYIGTHVEIYTIVRNELSAIYEI